MNDDQSEFLDPHPPVTKPELEDRNVIAEESLKKWTRPWIRFWARMIDYSLLYLFFWFALAIADISLGLAYPWLFPFFLSFVWIFIESSLLVTWGTTPGKWFLKTKLAKENGEKPSYRDALKRSVAVWFLGFGAGVPFVSILTSIVANVKLSNSGKTTWDRNYHFEVHHKRIGYWRTFITVIFFIITLAFMNQSINSQ